MRRYRIGLAVGLFLALPACALPFPTDNPVSTYQDFRQAIDAGERNEDLPAITIALNASGRDAVDVYTEDGEGTRITMAEDIAEWLGVEIAIAEPNLFYDNVATAQLDQRLVSRQDDAWLLSFDTAGLLPILHDSGYEGANLSVCHPNVEVRVTSSRPADFDAFDVDCYNGLGWEVLDESPVSVSLTLVPSTQDYLIFIAAAILGILVLSGLAWLVGSKLREGPFRRRNAAAVAIGIVAGLFLIVGAGTMTGTTAAGLGPSDNLALAKDLGAGMFALSAAIPALAGTIPGLLFMVLLVKRRPWPDEPLRREELPWPAPPPPPAHPGAPPPPPLP